MKGVFHSRICTSVLWTLFFSFLLVRGDDFLEQGMCLIKLKLIAFFLPYSIVVRLPVLTFVFTLEY